MKAIAEWLLAKGWRIPLTFVLMAVVPDQSGQWLPLLAWIGGTAILVLATLRSGADRGIQLTITGALAVAVVGYTMQRVEAGVAHPDLLTRLLLWVPALISAAVVRRTRSLTFGMQVLLLVGLVGLGLVFLLADPYAYWISREVSPEDARLATGIFVAAYVGFVAASVLIAHYGESGGREQEHWGFSTFAMGKSAAVVSAVMMLAALSPAALYFENAVIVLGVGFALQGLAVANAWMAGRGLTGMWAVALYAGMLLAIMVTLPLLVGIGFIDNWLQLRQRGRLQR